MIPRSTIKPVYAVAYTAMAEVTVAFHFLHKCVILFVRACLSLFNVVDNLLKHFFFLTLLDSAFKKLNSINDLRKIDFGRKFPQHGLMLLHWFANKVDIDNNNIIQLSFEPNRGDYGIHYCGNYEQLLDILPDSNARNRLNFSYYTVGNLNPNSKHNNARALPYDVTRSFYNSRGNQDNNRDRIIIRIRKKYRQPQPTVEQVYITQHYRGGGSAYDRANTYRVSTDLLREIRGRPQITPEQVNRTVTQQIQRRYRNIDENSWKNLLSWKLLLLLMLALSIHHVLGEIIMLIYFSRSGALEGVYAMSHGDDEDADDLLDVNLEVRTTRDGKAKICWSGIPRKHIQQGVMVALFKSNEDHANVSKKSVEGSSGSFDTSVPLNPGLQVRLHKHEWPFRSFWLFTLVGKEIQRGPEFHDGNGEMPVYIKGHDNASLQLFVKDGKACVRLYVRKTFTDWKTKFYNSWVGIYPSTTTHTSNYKVYQWVIEFAREWRSDLEDIPDYNVYVFHSGVTISPGVQVRFMLRKVPDPLVCTPPWE